MASNAFETPHAADLAGPFHILFVGPEFNRASMAFACGAIATWAEHGALVTTELRTASVGRPPT